MDDVVQEISTTVRERAWDRSALGARARSELDRCASVEKVISAMHERIDRPFGLEEMARIAYLSRFYFNRVFREVTGAPPVRFHTALRIAAAKRLLLTSDLSVTEICLEVGYQSLGTFTTHFHELVGVSPRELRRIAAQQWDAPAALGGAADPAETAAVEGTVDGVEDDGLVFIGLFRQPYPHGLPIACTAVEGAGRYVLRTPAEGCAFTAAAAFPSWSDDVARYLLADDGSTLIASPTPAVQLGGGGPARRDLHLRPVRSTDPPVLLVLPPAAARSAAAASLV
jgi:AraC family transcriptional regulator